MKTRLLALMLIVIVLMSFQAKSIAHNSQLTLSYFVSLIDIPALTLLLDSDQKSQRIDLWYGEDQLDTVYLYGTIKKVLKTLDMDLKDEEDFILLIMETVAIESNFGYHVTQIKGPALGVVQIQPSTYRSLNKNFLRINTELKEKVDLFKRNDLTDEENLTYNLEYQIAYAAILYIANGCDARDLSTKNKRARIYKIYFNSLEGKATVEDFIRKTSYIEYHRIEENTNA